MNARPSWFSSNWKWLLPLGCLAPVLCCLSFAGVTYFGVTKAIEASRPFEMAMEKVRSSDEVKEALGLPLQTRLGMRGTMNETSGSGAADFMVPISGPKGTADLHVVATASGDTWTLTVVDVTTRDTTIDLVESE